MQLAVQVCKHVPNPSEKRHGEGFQDGKIVRMGGKAAVEAAKKIVMRIAQVLAEGRLGVEKLIIGYSAGEQIKRMMEATWKRFVGEGSAP